MVSYTRAHGKIFAMHGIAWENGNPETLAYQGSLIRAWLANCSPVIPIKWEHAGWIANCCSPFVSPRYRSSDSLRFAKPLTIRTSAIIQLRRSSKTLRRGAR